MGREEVGERLCTEGARGMRLQKRQLRLLCHHRPPRPRAAGTPPAPPLRARPPGRSRTCTVTAAPALRQTRAAPAFRAVPEAKESGSAACVDPSGASSRSSMHPCGRLLGDSGVIPSCDARLAVGQRRGGGAGGQRGVHRRRGALQQAEGPRQSRQSDRHRRHAAQQQLPARGAGPASASKRGSSTIQEFCVENVVTVD